MRVLVLADIHANLAALEAVLAHASALCPIDSAWCMGDTVGYGPQPRECIARLRELNAVSVAGNHDRAAAGSRGTIVELNPDARTAALWTRTILQQDDRDYLDSLPEVLPLSPGPVSVAIESENPLSDRTLQHSSAYALTRPTGAEFTLVHGTLRQPIWEYLYSHEAASAHLRRQNTPFSFVGHTHVPMLAIQREDLPRGCEMERLREGSIVRLDDNRKLAINPGSVGQPRDEDPRAAYAVYDTEAATVSLQRVEYDFRETQRLMEEARLPRWLIERLAVGQ